MMFRVTVLAAVLAGSLMVSGGEAVAATVKPLEIFSEKILALEVEYLATEHALASSRLRKAVERLNREMNITSKERIIISLAMLTKVSDALAETVKSSAALNSYVTANSSRLKSSGHEKFLPLAAMVKECETPYQLLLGRVVVTAGSLVNHCNDHFAAVSSGDKETGKRYEELFAAYQKDTEQFNEQSMARSRYLTEMGTEYPSLQELLPR